MEGASRAGDAAPDRAHGSGLFQRGQTQVLTIATLGTPRDEQKLDDLLAEAERTVIYLADGALMIEVSEHAFEAEPMRIDGRGSTVYLEEALRSAASASRRPMA